MTKILLNTAQMARFVSDGFLRFDEVVPQDICRAAMAEMENADIPQSWPDSDRICTGTFSDMWKGSAIKQAFDLPIISGAIDSLVGQRAGFDHHAIHLVGANSRRGADLHQDSTLDLRQNTFDIQFSFFPHDVTVEMGGTLFVPGSHFHRPRLNSINRYHHVRGQVQTVCRAGTMVAWHHNLWHSARSNCSDDVRYMFKLRLSPQVKQCQLWNCEDLDTYDPMNDLMRNHGWFGDEFRHVLMHRARMWQSLTGNEQFDILGFHTRLANNPQCQQRAQAFAVVG